MTTVRGSESGLYRIQARLKRIRNVLPVLITLAPHNQHFFRDRAHRSTPIRIELEKNNFVQQVNTHLRAEFHVRRWRPRLSGVKNAKC